MKEIQEFEFIFENCESFKMDRKYIGGCYIDHITSYIGRNALNDLSEKIECGEVFFEFAHEGNELYSCWGGDGQYKFDRFKAWNDITAINVIYKDGTEKYILTPWEDVEGSDVVNKYQSSAIAKNGDMFLLISITKDVLDVINPEELNRDEDYLFGCGWYE